jgi:hypothetical protein
MRNLFLVIIVMTLFSCNSKELINVDGIRNVVLIINPLEENGEKAKEIHIEDKSRIQKIVNHINRANRESAVFRSTYKIEINYINNKKTIILCNGQRINIEGETYKLNSDIEEIVFQVNKNL